MMSLSCNIDITYVESKFRYYVIHVGVDAAAVTGKRREATGNEVKPTRGGDLR